MSVLRLTSTMSAVVLLLSVFTAPAIADQRVALVIGNASYAHAPVLASPLNDAAKIAAALGRLGFAVTRVENAGYAALRRSLQQFASAASSSEVALVFYTGHTIQVDQSNFLVPVDARLLSDGDIEFETVPLALVLRAVERAPGLRLIILDASRRNPRSPRRCSGRELRARSAAGLRGLSLRAGRCSRMQRRRGRSRRRARAATTPTARP